LIPAIRWRQLGPTILLGLCGLLILVTVLPSIRKSREVAFAGGS
jgi:hypothetical protein